jgi:hypothetical protein
METLDYIYEKAGICVHDVSRVGVTERLFPTLTERQDAFLGTLLRSPELRRVTGPTVVVVPKKAMFGSDAIRATLERQGVRNPVVVHDTRYLGGMNLWTAKREPYRVPPRAAVIHLGKPAADIVGHLSSATQLFDAAVILPGIEDVQRNDISGYKIREAINAGCGGKHDYATERMIRFFETALPGNSYRKLAAMIRGLSGNPKTKALVMPTLRDVQAGLIEAAFTKLSVISETLPSDSMHRQLFFHLVQMDKEGGVDRDAEIRIAGIVGSAKGSTSIERLSTSLLHACKKILPERIFIPLEQEVVQRREFMQDVEVRRQEIFDVLNEKGIKKRLIGLGSSPARVSKCVQERLQTVDMATAPAVFRQILRKGIDSLDDVYSVCNALHENLYAGDMSRSMSATTTLTAFGVSEKKTFFNAAIDRITGAGQKKKLKAIVKVTGPQVPRSTNRCVAM